MHQLAFFLLWKWIFRDSICIRGMQFRAFRVTLKFKRPDFELVYVKSVMRCFLQCTRRHTFPVTTRNTFYLHRPSHNFKQWFHPLCRRGKFARKCSSLHLLFVPMFAHIFNLRLGDAYISIRLLLQILLFELAPRASGLCWASVLIFKGPFSSPHSQI
jgi:hypothetical protein